MIIETITQDLTALKLTGMLNALRALQEQNKISDVSLIDGLDLLVT